MINFANLIMRGTASPSQSGNLMLLVLAVMAAIACSSTIELSHLIFVVFINALGDTFNSSKLRPIHNFEVVMLLIFSHSRSRTS